MHSGPAYSRSRLTAAILAVSAVAPAAIAGPPVSFDRWSANNGNITSACPSGYTCEVNVADDGILQRLIIDADGNRYIQQIISDSSASGAMNAESFVNANQAQNINGIALKQRVQSTLGNDVMDSLAVINTGWAITPGEASVVLHQTIDSSTEPSVGYHSSFDYRQNRNTAGNITGFAVDIRQDVTDSSQLANTTATGQDIHSFVMRRRSGDEVRSSGSVSLPSTGGGGMMGDGGGPAGGTMSWRTGDDITTIWIGQVCEGCQDSGMGGMGGMGGMSGSLFSYQAYDNLSDSAAAVATRSLNTTDPINWTSAFGAQPSLGP